MPLTLTDVITPTTAAEIEAEVLLLCATADPPLPTSSWQPGSVVRTMIAEVSEMVARKALVETEIAKGGFGDLASPLWAKLWAQQIYDVIFVPAAVAKGDVDAVNTTGTPHTLNPGDLILAHRTTGKTYRNQATITIPANATLSNIAVQADEVGTASNAAEGFVSKIIAPALIGVTVSNPLAILGADEEATVALVARTRAKLGSFSPLGPKDAYDYVARTPLDSFPPVNGNTLTPTSTPITRSRTSSNPATGDVVVYCATAGGAPSGGDIALVQLGFDRWAEPHCVRSIAAAAVNHTVNVTYRVWIKSSFTEAQVATIIATALSVYLSAIPVGGVLVPPDTGAIYAESLTFIIHTALPGVVRVELTPDPFPDIVLTPDEVPVVGTISPTVTFL